MSEAVPNRAKDPKRSPLNFYDAAGNYSHTADVRWVASRGAIQPHKSDLKKHQIPMGEWAVPEYDNNPNAPERGKK